MNARTVYLSTLLAASASLAACGIGPTEHGSFDRTLDVSGPLRLELSTASGFVRINGSADGKVHIHGEVSAGSFMGNAKEELQRVISSPPIEQHAGIVRIGKSGNGFRNTSIAYIIEVPRETELSVSSASGAQDIQNIRGPVNVDTASGEIHIENVDRGVTAKSVSGSIHVGNLGDDARLRLVVDGHQRDLSIVIDETKTRQPLVCGSLAQRERLGIAGIDRFLGEHRVEPGHERFIFRTDRADQ
jgi:hypothetical protein